MRRHVLVVGDERPPQRLCDGHYQANLSQVDKCDLYNVVLVFKTTLALEFNSLVDNEHSDPYADYSHHN